MSFSLDRFYQLNRRTLIWIILIALLWLLRDFFGLIFITFVLAFIATPLVQFASRKLRLPHRLSLTVVYILFLIILTSFVRYVTPGVIGEANRFIANFGQVQDRLVQVERDISRDYPGVQRSLHGYLRSLLSENELATMERQRTQLLATMGLDEMQLAEYPWESAADRDPHLRARIEEFHRREAEVLLNLLIAGQVDNVRALLPGLVNSLYKGTGTMLLALLFSFLILLDSARLSQQMKSLNVSRLRDFYEEAAHPVLRFAYIVGRAMQAQALIALTNTFLTLVGLLILGIPSLALLSLIVFVCSFIPVLGVIISTIPIVLVALNTGGLNLALGAIVMVVFIHIVEAYMLNPMIYGKHMKLNPVFVLMILLVAYHGFGLWGMLIGVPVAHYFIHDVFGVPLWDEKRLRPQQSQPGVGSVIATGPGMNLKEDKDKENSE